MICIASIFFAAFAITATSADSPPAARNMQEVTAQSYWAIYNATAAPAADSCLVTEGESVAEACCDDAGEKLPHAMLQGNDTCFVLGEDLIPFSGCVGDGVAGYGENCVGEGNKFFAAFNETTVLKEVILGARYETSKFDQLSSELRSE